MPLGKFVGEFLRLALAAENVLYLKADNTISRLWRDWGFVVKNFNIKVRRKSTQFQEQLVAHTKATYTRCGNESGRSQTHAKKLPRGRFMVEFWDSLWLHRMSYIPRLIMMIMLNLVKLFISPFPSRQRD